MLSDKIQTTCEDLEVAPMCPEKIAEKTRRAVVAVRTVPRFTQFWQMYSRFLEKVNGTTHYTQGIIPISGTGVYTPENVIVTTTGFTNILSIASLVMTFSLPLNYIPGTNNMHSDFQAFNEARNDPDPTTLTTMKGSDLPGFVDVLREVCNGAALASFFDWYIDLEAPNGCSFSYRAQLVGCEFETGMALLKIRSSDPWNRRLNPIGRQDVLEWGVSREAVAGSPAYCMYSSRLSGPGTFSSGTITNPNASMYDGSMTIDVMQTTIPVGYGAEGAPILNSCAQMIGIVIGVTDNGHAIAIPSSFVKRIYTALVESLCTRDCNKLVVKIDAIGALVFQHGTMGQITYHTKTAIDLNASMLSVALADGECNTCGSSNQDSNCGCQCGESFWNNRDVVGSNDRMDRRNFGVVLTADPCGPISEVWEECIITDPNFSEQRKRRYNVRRGDWITHIDGIPIGQGAGQRSIDDILFCLGQGCDVRVTFRKQSQKYNYEHYLSVCLASSIAFIPTFRKCCIPCISSSLPAICWGNGGNVFPAPTTPGDLVQQVADLLHLITCWFGLLRWTSNTLSQVYRATLFGNMTLVMTRMNELIGALTQLKPAGCTNPSLLPWPFNNLPLGLSQAVPTPLSIGLALTQLSRTVVSAVAEPSISTAVRPITFYDFTASIPHPGSACAFEQTVPAYTAIIGSVLNNWLKAYSPDLPPFFDRAARNAAAETVAATDLPKDFSVSVENIEAQIRAKAGKRSAPVSEDASAKKTRSSDA
jgi:hypothetical protein